MLSPIEPTARVRQEIQHAQGWLIEDTKAANGEAYRVATVAARGHFAKPFPAYAQLVVPLRDRDREIWRFVGWVIAGSLVVLAAGGLAALHLAGQWLAPLGVMGQAAESVDARNLARQRIVAPPDVLEVAPMVGAFNSLLDRLELAQAAQQRFVADASHELRTPLTILRGEIEVALRRDRSTPDHRQTLESCREEIESLSRLVDGLLLLARCDGGIGGCQSRRAATSAARPARSASACRAWPGAEPQPGDRGHRNRLGSARRWSARTNRVEPRRECHPALAPGEQIVVQAVCEEQGAVLRVTDRGIGIPADHQSRIFDRFYRVETGASRDGGGTGLGLAIVKAMAEASGGSVSVRSEIGQGSEFTVRWPALGSHLNV